MADNPADLTVLEAAAAMRAGNLSSQELVDACLDRIAKRDGTFEAWLRVYDDRALAAAREADRRRRENPDQPLLCGIPIGLKDVIGVQGLPLTADSAVLEGNVATEDAAAWARLADQGAVLLGHLHCGEFACGVWGRNPWGAQLVQGGSSSGSAIALATRSVPATLGSDGRGSIRIPASANNVTGVKPTFGLVSTAGCVPITWSYDVVGPMARTAADCAVLLDAMAGPGLGDSVAPVGARDAGRVRFPHEPRAGRRPLAGTRLGVPILPEGYLADGVVEVFAAFQEDLARLGAELVPYQRPDNPLNDDLGTGPGWRTILVAEARAIHRQFADRTDRYRMEFTSQFEVFEQGVGDATDYVLAQMKRGELVASWRGVFEQHRLDAVLEPNSPVSLAQWDQPISTEGDEETIRRAIVDYLSKDFMGVWNDAQFPAVMVPGGPVSPESGPCGIQFVGLPYADASLLQLAIDYQAATDHHLEQPPDLDALPTSDARWVAPPRRETGEPQAAYVHRPPLTTVVLPN